MAFVPNLLRRAEAPADKNQFRDGGRFYWAPLMMQSNALHLKLSTLSTEVNLGTVLGKFERRTVKFEAPVMRSQCSLGGSW